MKLVLKTLAFVVAAAVAWVLLAEAVAHAAPNRLHRPVVVKDADTGDGRQVTVANPTSKKLRVTVECWRLRFLVVTAETVILPKRRATFDFEYPAGWSDRDVREQGLRAGDCRVSMWEPVR